jgi:hypothetical protein
MAKRHEAEWVALFFGFRGVSAMAKNTTRIATKKVYYAVRC